MSVQSEYRINHLQAYEGGRGDSRPMKCFAGRNNAGAELPYGRFVVHDTGAGTSELAFKAPSAAGQKVLGVLLHDQAHESQTTGLADDAMGSIISGGSVWMIAEGTVGPSDDVYMRFATAAVPGASDAIGRVGKIRAGVADVWTVTPTATNSVNYMLTVSVSGREFPFHYLADASATATEICDGFRAAMAADAAFTALVVATGTVTLILTGQTAGLAIKVQSGSVGALASVNTTPAAPTAELVPGARFLTTATIGLPVMVDLNLP